MLSFAALHNRHATPSFTPKFQRTTMKVRSHKQDDGVVKIVYSFRNHAKLTTQSQPACRHWKHRGREEKGEGREGAGVSDPKMSSASEP